MNLRDNVSICAVVTEELRHMYGLCLLRLGKPGEAKEVFQAILASNPNHAEARASIGYFQADR